MTEQELSQQIDAIKTGPALIVAAVQGLDARTFRHKADPKKWCVLEILAHLADVEVLYGYRMRQMIADAQPTIAPIDQDDWARNLGYMEASPEESLESFLAARRANLRLLRRLKPSDLEKSAFHPEHKRKVTLGELIGMMARHEPNHLAQIERLKQSAAAQARTA